MAEAIEVINEIIANAIEIAQDNTAEATSAADKLIRKQSGIYVDPPDSLSGFAPAAVEPDIPTAEDSTLTYEAQLEKIIALLTAQFANFFATYYPLASDAFDEATAWLVDTITNGGTGINADIEDQVWQRGRDRVVADSRRTKYQIAVGYAAKGYSLASGSMLKKMEEAEYNAAMNNGIASTSIAAKQLEIEIETIKFAVGKAIDSRTMAMNAAADYIRSLATAPDAAARVASINTDNQSRMVSAYASWYNARQERDRLVLSSKLAELTSRDEVYKHRRTNATQNSQVEVQALAAAADNLARTAAAALTSLNSIVSSSVNAFA